MGVMSLHHGLGMHGTLHLAHTVRLLLEVLGTGNGRGTGMGRIWDTAELGADGGASLRCLRSHHLQDVNDFFISFLVL